MASNPRLRLGCKARRQVRAWSCRCAFCCHTQGHGCVHAGVRGVLRRRHPTRVSPVRTASGPMFGCDDVNFTARSPRRACLPRPRPVEADTASSDSRWTSPDRVIPKPIENAGDRRPATSRPARQYASEIRRAANWPMPWQSGQGVQRRAPSPHRSVTAALVSIGPPATPSPSPHRRRPAALSRPMPCVHRLDSAAHRRSPVRAAVQALPLRICYAQLKSDRDDRCGHSCAIQLFERTASCPPPLTGPDSVAWCSNLPR